MASVEFPLVVLLLILPFLLANSISSRTNRTSRIVGGTTAYSGQFPFSAAIYVTTATSTHFCGGALIDDQFIISAGSCADGATLFTIRLGSNTLTSSDSNRVTVATSHYFLHPEYNSVTLEHNIALIQLRMSLTFTTYIQPIKLTDRDVTTYAHFTAIGWGQTSDSNPQLSESLQFVSLISISNEECANVYGYQVSSDMVCATGNYIEGTCLGDIGTPLIEHIYNPQTVRHAGVASFISGDGCEHPHPSGYTRTYLYLDWILNITSSNNYSLNQENIS